RPQTKRMSPARSRKCASSPCCASSRLWPCRWLRQSSSADGERREALRTALLAAPARHGRLPRRRHRAVGSRRRGPARLELLIVSLADPRSWHRRANAKAKRRIIGEWLAKLQTDMLTAVEQMPENWDETELQWLLVRRAR